MFVRQAGKPALRKTRQVSKSVIATSLKSSLFVAAGDLGLPIFPTTRYRAEAPESGTRTSQLAGWTPTGCRTGSVHQFSSFLALGRSVAFFCLIANPYARQERDHALASKESYCMVA